MKIEIGKVQTLEVIREEPEGWYLVGDDETGEILLPLRYAPENMMQLDEIEVFVYCDSDDNPVATTERPLVMAGEFACLEVMDIHPTAGAFLNWGLPKDLLLPYREQPVRVRKGEKVVVYVMADERSGRMVATRRFNRFLDVYRVTVGPGDAVDILVYEQTPLGYNAIVNSSWRGLLFRSDLGSEPMFIGRRLKGFVREIRANGKIDLTLNASGYQRVAPLGELILEALRENGGSLAFDDKSDPELIRDAFEVSKKAFKQALGLLYKQKLIRFEAPGIVLVNL